MPEYQRSLVWFRRDLRDYDHAALYHALKRARQVLCVFVFDRDILDALTDPADRRVEFIHASVTELQQALQAKGGGLIVKHGVARDEMVRLAADVRADAVFFNHDDDDPAALARDAAVESALRAHDIAVHHTKDAVIFEREEVLTAGGTPYSVFTPYKKAWLKTLTPYYLQAYPVDVYADRLTARSTDTPALQDMGFAPNLAELRLPTGMSGGAQLLDDFMGRIDRYQEARDFPAKKGPSYLSGHLRFGTVPIRQLAAAAWQRGGRGRKPGCPN